jgi:hypothetical protein
MLYKESLTALNKTYREREKVGGSERHYILGWGQEIISPILKVPRQCPLVLLV